ncbi:MAG: hypothetical protein MHPSP_004845, partial [Paramarteilia canceri]
PNEEVNDSELIDIILNKMYFDLSDGKRYSSLGDILGNIDGLEYIRCAKDGRIDLIDALQEYDIRFEPKELLNQNISTREN